MFVNFGNDKSFGMICMQSAFIGGKLGIMIYHYVTLHFPHNASWVKHANLVHQERIAVQFFIKSFYLA